MAELKNSPTLNKYKDTIRECISLYYPNLSNEDLNKAIEYSIEKRLVNSNAKIVNSYTGQEVEKTLLMMSDYIAKKEPIVTALGTMFKHHADCPNPMFQVIQSFLDNRAAHKKEMFKYPKGSEEFEKYNLLQSLDKIDANGTYGAVGQYSCLLYNVNVASSITAQGRAFISSASICFEMFLNNNVLFGSLNEVIEFINHIINESPYRRFDDNSILDEKVSVEDCFAKIVLSCGYRWIPNENEMEIIWRIINNISQENLNRIYYKNNLFNFVNNTKVFNIVRSILHKLKRPLLNSLDIPADVANDMKLFGDLLSEYVYYRHLIIDRIDRCDNMIKSVIAVSDTDSAIVSLDGWYRYVVEKINGEELAIANYNDHAIFFHDFDDEGNSKDNFWTHPVKPIPKKLDYNFMTDEITEIEHTNNPDIITPNDNVRFSIINIMAYVLDRVVNDYMEKVCENNHSLRILDIVQVPLTQDQINISNYYDIGLKYDHKNNPKPSIVYKHDRKCRMIMKNEFSFKRILITSAKKHYASLQVVQEGNLIPENKQLDIKGIDVLYKSTTPLSTRKALQKILLEDIMKTPAIDQLRVIKDIAIFEKQLIESVKNGDRTYYKPATVKSMSSYSDPLRIQGVKASIAWNKIKSSDYQPINLEERHAVDIAKVIINKANVEKIADKYPEVYNNMLAALNDDIFKGTISSVAIPLDVVVPEWLTEFIDYDTIIADNISGFPIESIGISKLGRSKLAYTNIVEL